MSKEERNPKYWYERMVYFLNCKILNIISSTSNGLTDIIYKYKEWPKSGYLEGH